MFEKMTLEIVNDMLLSTTKAWVANGELHFSVRNPEDGIDIEDEISQISVKNFNEMLKWINIKDWKPRYVPEMEVLDGTSWCIKYKEVNGKEIRRSGENAYPDNWEDFLFDMNFVTNVNQIR